MHDVAVIGLGAAGAATLHALTQRGVDVVGVDRFSPPHAMGSSHGETRMLRVAYGEGAGYTPLAARARTLWRQLEAQTGAVLFEQTGLVYAGPRDSAFLAETWRSGEAHDLGLRRLPTGARDGLGFEVPADWQVIEEPGAGFLWAERAIATLLEDARRRGARIVTDDPASSIETTAGGLAIPTAAGPIRARRLIVCAGGWTASLIPALAAVLSVERRTIHWFDDPRSRFSPAAGFRPFYIEDISGTAVYGLPNASGAGIKIGEHLEGQPTAGPDGIERAVSATDEDRIRALASRWFARLGPIRASQVCLYPMSRDQDFIVDRLPGEPRITVVCGLSGHGFKFAPALGEAAAALALDEAPPLDMDMFKLARFGPSPPRPPRPGPPAPASP